VVLLGRDGLVLASRRGWMSASELLSKLAEVQGTTVPEAGPQRAFTGVRDPGAPKAAVREVTAVEAAERLAREGSRWILLDVRTAAEFDDWHPDGAVGIPLDELPHRYQDLGQNTDVVCLSETGGESAAAAEFLTSVGFSDVLNVVDGITGWPDAPDR
jgi:rhodanese-related sulfurtransferase